MLDDISGTATLRGRGRGHGEAGVLRGHGREGEAGGGARDLPRPRGERRVGRVRGLRQGFQGCWRGGRVRDVRARREGEGVRGL